MTIDEKALREAAEAATPGPWSHSWDAGVKAAYGSARDGDVVADCFDGSGQGLRDAVFIAAANPQVVLALLDGVEVARQKLNLIRALHHDAPDGCSCRLTSNECSTKSILDETRAS